MNLQTHVFFGAMLAAIFIGHPDIVMIVAVGSLIPDLDREYWFRREHVYREEQLHRSLFHNLFFIALLFFVNQWLALGAFLHTLLDALTTVEDRGVEWLFPLSRLVKRGIYGYGSQLKDGKCAVQLIKQEQNDRVSFLDEDSIEMTGISDPDLREMKPVPWRRTYGPAKNGKIIDNWFFIGSLSVLVIYSALHPAFLSQTVSYVTSSTFYPLALLLVAIILFYVSGELERSGKSRILYVTLAAIGIASLIIAAILEVSSLSSYSLPIDPMFAAVSLAVLTIEGVLIWRYSIRGGRKAVV